MKSTRFALPLLLGVLLAAGCRSTTSPSDSSAVAKPVTAAVDPVEAEYQKLVAEDDAAHEEVDQWIKEAAEFEAAGAGTQKANLQAKIVQRLDGLDRRYRTFLELHPNHAKARLAYGSFLNDQGKEEEAVAHWEQARQLDPANPAAWNNLANYYGHRSPVKKAFEYYAKAMELDPTEPVYVWNFATTVYLFRVDAKEFYGIDENGVFEKALDLYRKAVALDPKNFILASDYANSFYGTKPPRYEDGLVAWEAAYQVAGDDIEREGVCIHLARCHINLKRYDEAETQLKRVKHPMYDALRKRLEDRIARERAGRTDSDPESAPAPRDP